MLTAICIVITILLVILNGYFSMSEMALVNARKTKLQQLADEGSRKAKDALQLASETDNLFATIQVAITLVGFATSAVAATTISDPVAHWLASFGVPWLTKASGFIAVAVITILVAYISLILGELFPKRIAMASSEKVAMRVAGFLIGFEKVFRPIVRFLSASTNLLARIFNVKSGDEPEPVSEDEIIMLVNNQETLLDEEKRMIEEIFDLGDTVAREIMVPRVDMVLAEDTMTVKQVIDRMRGTGFSRLPVFHDDHDKIIGVTMVKDLLVPLIDDREDELIVNFMREPVFVPETKGILPLLQEMQNEHNQMVIVVDEYGGTAGILSIEDIVEEVVGEIADEYDPDRKYITRLSDDEWLIDGRFPIDDAIDEGFPVVESEKYDTIAGWLLDAVDFVPSTGDRFEIDGYAFTVKSMRRRRISLLIVEKLNIALPAPHEFDD